MTGMAADLTDRVIPFVPVRQFVLSVPHRLRYLMAYDHDRCTAALRIFIRALLSFYARRARKAGIPNGRTGTVTFIQRFGSSANLNVHFHVVVLDGVFAETSDGRLLFHAAAPPTEAELHRLVDATRRRVLRHMHRSGLNGSDDEVDSDPVAATSAVLASCYAGSVQGRQTIGRGRGAKLERIGTDPYVSWRDTNRALHAHVEGFDLHASRVIHAEQPDMRSRLEDLLRYCARPPIADDRLSLNASGQVILRLKTPWHDGTTHVVYDPLDFISKLAALVPRPQKNLVIYHGVLAANAAWRVRVVAYGRLLIESKQAPGGAGDHLQSACIPRHLRRQWAELMRRGFGLDVLACSKCGGRLRLLAIIIDRRVVRKLLDQAKLPTEPPRIKPWRAPPPGSDLPFDDVA